MAIDETPRLTKGLVRKLNALLRLAAPPPCLAPQEICRPLDDLAEEVFARWLEAGGCLTIQPLRSRSKPDPVAMKIVEALTNAGFENDPKLNLGNHGYTLRRAKGKGGSGFSHNPGASQIPWR